MSNLRTDYTDAVWVGSKRYIIGDNGDGSSSITDITPYTNRENSFFGAADANAINGAMNRKANIPTSISVSLTPAGWEGSVSPYYQMLNNPAIVANTQLNINLNNSIIQTMNQSGTIALYCENHDGVAKVFAVGGKPISTISLPITLQEVEI